MNNSALIGADEIAQTLDVSKAFAYQVIRNLNQKLKQRGYITIAGRVSRRFFVERFYGYSLEEEDQNSGKCKES